MRQLEDLVWNRDERELAPDERDRLAEPEPTEGGRLPEGPRVELEPAQEAQDAGASGSGERLLRQVGGIGLARLGQA